MSTVTDDAVLANLRQHPDGITLPEIVRTYYADEPFKPALKSVYRRLCRLEKYGYAERETYPAPVTGGRQTVWRAL